MATRIYEGPVRSLNQAVTVIIGSFGTNGAGAPINQLGLGYTAARTSAGKFTVTLTDKYARILSGTPSLQLHVPPTPVQASLTINGADGNGNLTYTASANLPGTAGNNFKVVHLGGVSQSLAVSVVGVVVTVQLGTNGGGTVTSTATAVAAAVNGNANAAALVSAAASGTGASVAGIQGATFLANGSGAVLNVTLGDIDVVTAKTAVILVQDVLTGTATDIAAQANNRVHFRLEVQNSFYA